MADLGPSWDPRRAVVLATRHPTPLLGRNLFFPCGTGSTLVAPPGTLYVTIFRVSSGRLMATMPPCVSNGPRAPRFFASPFHAAWPCACRTGTLDAPTSPSVAEGWCGIESGVDSPTRHAFLRRRSAPAGLCGGVPVAAPSRRLLVRRPTRRRRPGSYRLSVPRAPLCARHRNPLNPVG